MSFTQHQPPPNNGGRHAKRASPMPPRMRWHPARARVRQRTKQLLLHRRQYGASRSLSCSGSVPIDETTITVYSPFSCAARGRKTRGCGASFHLCVSHRGPTHKSATSLKCTRRARNSHQATRHLQRVVSNDRKHTLTTQIGPAPTPVRHRPAAR